MKTPLTLLVAVGVLAACASDPAADTAGPTGTTEVVDETGPVSPPSVAANTTAEPAGATTSTTAIASTTVATTSATTTTTTTSTTVATTSCASTLDLRAVAALVVWPAAEPTRWAEAVDAVEQHDVGGVVLMGPRDWDAAEVTRRLADLEASSRHGLVISTDEEGGDVQRLRMLDRLPSQRDLARSTDDLAAVRAAIAAHGELVRATGVDVVFGPVVDVEPVAGDVPLAPSRFFPGDAEDVSTLAGAYVDGWNDAGLVATLKHYPGHGGASGDTHDVDGVTADLDALRRRDLVPFEQLGDRVASGGALVMVGHLTVPGLTAGVPATRSPEAIALLRSTAGHEDALVVTDALGMGAVGLPEPEASAAAIAAGIDVVIFTQTSQTGPVIDAIVAAVESGVIDETALRVSAARVLRLLERDGHRCDAPAS